MIVFYASDLTWGVKIKSTAETLGVPARPVRSIDMLEARLADSPVVAFIADLAAPEVALALIERVHDENRRRSENPAPEITPGTATHAAPDGAGAAPRTRQIRILAFGPHVEVDALQRARDLGAHEVMPRGAFSHNLPDILVRLNG
ncbi:MAG: hypothetical protein KF684_11470 [Phycisphaeraceae bacterium]|nr:hypothetical protein [Phycisphaeraceae bacterium]